MYSCQLNMLHNRRHKGMCPIADGIRFTFHGMIQETVDEDRAVGSNADCGLHIARHAFIIVNHFHTAST